MDDIFALSRHFLPIYNREYRRYFFDQILMDHRFSILLGQRGVGKTTAMVQKILSQYPIHSTEALYVPVDHFLVGNKQLFEIADYFYNHGGKLLCFDEIHKYNNWAKELKSIYDSFPDLDLIVSGSSALEIQKQSHDLSRRSIVHSLFGLSLREHLNMHYETNFEPFSLETILNHHEEIALQIITEINKKGLKILALFKTYLKSGYYPYSLNLKNQDLYYLTIEQGMHATIENDLIALHPELTGVSIKKIKKLLSVITESVPFTLDLSKLKRLTELGDERTLKNYLTYLEKGGILTCLSKFAKGLKTMRKPDKIFLNNPNQIYAISSYQKDNIGSIRETCFICFLKPVSDLIEIPAQGDFIVNGQYTFEIGGKKKTFNQIKNIANSFLVLDDVELTVGNKIPLWLFGFLY